MTSLTLFFFCGIHIVYVLLNLTIVNATYPHAISLSQPDNIQELGHAVILFKIIGIKRSKIFKVVLMLEKLTLEKNVYNTKKVSIN